MSRSEWDVVSNRKTEVSEATRNMKMTNKKPLTLQASPPSFSMSAYVNKDDFYKERIQGLEIQTVKLSNSRDNWRLLATVSTITAVLGWFIVLSVIFGGYL